MFTLDIISSGSSTDGGIVIGGTMGGVILLLVIITVVLCIVMLCIKRYHKNKASSVDDQVSYSTTKLNTDVPIEHNPSYDVIKADNRTIKLYYNIPIKPYSKASEDECNYAQPNQHSDLMETVKMDSNPSYGVSTGDLGEYGVVNQPKSDTFGEPTRKLSEDTYVPVYGVVNQPKSDYLYSSSQPGRKISETKYGVVNQPMSDDPIIDETTM